ncbi:MAG: hypothetical protein WCT49_06215 [Candidatus Paceibacterota bacterium]|jgi:hypothetical protein|nr:hypothetical protein [Candidatus Paceibacterota bacterium]
MEWATKRKIIFISTALAIVAVIGALIYSLKFYEIPTCMDGKQNQGEEDVDCGGPCVVVCSNQIAQPIVLWQRAFESTPGVYNAVAYIENPNSGLGVQEATYRFTLYDEKNIFITERVGKTFIAPNERFAVFEARFNVGERVPKQAFFKFVSFSPWMKISGEKPPLNVRGEQVSDSTSKPRVDAVIENLQLVPIKGIHVTAIVYDSEDNAIASSATVIDAIAAQSSYDLVFTWIRPFRVPPVRVEIIPRINPFVAPAP